VKKGVQRALDSTAHADLHVVREATTGRVVVFSPTGNLPRVWAVAEQPQPLPEPVSQPLPGPLQVVVVAPAEVPVAAPVQTVPVELAFYRKYTEAMLRRYLRMSTEVGRVPSLLGRELFRGNVTHCKVNGFEDVVIFCHDMEQLLGRLRPMDRQLLRRIALQEYTLMEAAAMLGVSLRNSIRLYRRALDTLTEMLLEAKMLEPKTQQKCCQGGPLAEISISD